MRKFALLDCMAALALLGISAGASANAITSGSDCNYATAPPQDHSIGTTDSSGNQAYVYEGDGSTGNVGTTAIGACANIGRQGGYAETGHGTQGTYAVPDGNDTNPRPANWYYGVSKLRGRLARSDALQRERQ
jgi:hypothetical protein